VTLPPIIGRGPPRIAELRGRKAGGSDFSVAETSETSGTGSPVAIPPVTPLLGLQAEGGPQPVPARSLAQVAGGALRNLDRLQLSLLRADRIPDDLLDALAEAADHLALLLGQLPFVDSDIAKEDHVVFGKLFESCWEFFDVVFAAPADTV
jgi:hypothetical protein